MVLTFTPKLHPMSTQNEQSAADRPSEQRRDEKPTEGQTTGAQPGMPQHNEQGQPGNNDDMKSDPNPGPGIISQGHRVDEDTTADGNDQDKDRERPDTKKDMPSSDLPRDQDKDRKDPMDKGMEGNKMPEEAEQSRH